MKKLLLIGLSLALSSTAYCYTETREINASSFTATNDTTQQITGTSPNTDFRGVIIGTPSISGVLTIFDGQGANAASKIGVVSLSAVNELHFNVRCSSGITYTTTGNTGGVTLLYHVN